MVDDSELQNTSDSGSEPMVAPAQNRAAALGPVPKASESLRRNLVIRDIIQGLYDGRYRPGQKLVEQTLTSAFGLSRGTVREALNNLAARGIVTLTPQRGAHIRHINVTEAIDVLVVVQRLVSLAAGLAAARIARPGAADRLQNAVAALIDFSPSTTDPAYSRARDSFYGALTEIAGNSELRRILPSAHVHMIRIQYRSIMRGTDQTRHADYRRIMAAVLAGRVDAAERTAFAHIGRAIDALTPLLELPPLALVDTTKPNGARIGQTED